MVTRDRRINEEGATVAAEERAEGERGSVDAVGGSVGEEALKVDGAAGARVEDAPRLEEETARGLAAQSRRLRNSIISLAVFFAIVAGLLLAVPGLRSAGEKITDAQWGWVAVGVGLEVLSCISYVVLFGLVFGRLEP